MTVIDTFDPFYPRTIKEQNIRHHRDSPRWTLVEIDIRDAARMASLHGPYDAIVHLAARAGVRPSIADPIGYQGFTCEHRRGSS